MVGFACCCMSSMLVRPSDIWSEWEPSGTYHRELPSDAMICGRRHTDRKQISAAYSFVNLFIPQGSTITSAKLELAYVDGWQSNGIAVAVEQAGGTNYVYNKEAKYIARGYDVDSPTMPANAAALDAAARTTAQTSVTMETESAAAAGDNTLPGGSTLGLLADVTAILQECVDRAGWNTFSGFVVFLDENGSDFDNAASPPWGAFCRIDGGAGTTVVHPRLVVDYS